MYAYVGSLTIERLYDENYVFKHGQAIEDIQIQQLIGGNESRILDKLLRESDQSYGILRK